MSASRACTLLCTPRRIIRSVKKPNDRSTWLIQDEPVRVKCRQKRGWRASQGLDDRGLVGGEVVADQVHLEPGGHGLVNPGQELLELRGPVVAPQGVMTVPSAMLNAANRSVVPCRT